MGGRGSSSPVALAARSKWAEQGAVPLIVNNAIGNSGNYQGNNLGSGKGNSQFTIDGPEMKRQLDKLATNAPKIYADESARETLEQLESVENGAQTVTVYRATPSTQINHGGWVFLSEAQADSWARSTFTKEPKKGWSVVRATVPASMVGYSGKNLEFVLL